MRELLLRIDTSDGRRAGVERALRDAIRDGQMPAGSLLPSSRVLAADCGLARATVVAAYEQLAIEGYVIAERGSGTRVAEVPIAEDAGDLKPSPITVSPAADFRPGAPDPSLFPRNAWSRSVRRVVAETSEAAFGYADPLGVAELRVALAEYLGRSRAVFVDADGISIFGGATSSMGFIGEAFRSLGIDRIAVEDPSLFLLSDVLKIVGMELVPVPVDDHGIDVAHLAALDVQAVMVTPGHQFPLGITMSPERRAELVDWANDRDSWIIEDDYDGEFRYDRRSIGALQGLAPDRVIYAGTVSKMLTPGLRLSWLALPRPLRGPIARVKHLRAGVSTLDQLALADLITRGDLDRHLRAARSVYQTRQAALTNVLAEHAPWLDVSPSKAGLHLAATISKPVMTEAEIVKRAEACGVGLLGFGPMWLGEPSRQGITLGYSRPPAHRFASALEALAELLDSVSE